MRFEALLAVAALFAGSFAHLPQAPQRPLDWTSGALTLGDSSVVRFADITGMFVFYGGGKGGEHGRTFPVRADTGWVETGWKEIRSVEILHSQYGKIGRWPCLLSALVNVELKNGMRDQYTLDCLFWIELTLQPDNEGNLRRQTIRFFTPSGKLNIRRIDRD